MPKLITCPSGLSGEIRGLTGRAFELLGDKRRQREGLLGNAMLRECWMSTADPGPYELGNDGKPDWDKVLVGDRTYVLTQIRCCMYGPKYSFKVPCQECREPIQWDVDLLTLPVKPLAPEDLEVFRLGNKLRGELEDGRGFTFRLPIGVDETKAAKMGSVGSAFIPMLVSRIHSIDDMPENETLRRYFEAEEMATIFAFARAMDAHDCGIDTEVEVVCPRDSCGVVQTVNIPFGRGFLFPDGKTTKKRME